MHLHPGRPSRRSATGSTAAAVARALACAALLSALACEGVGAPANVRYPADSAAGEVNFTLAAPGEAAIVVEVYVNGHGPVNLIMDTGATLTCLNDSLARELSLPEQRGTIARGVGAAGGGGRVRLVHIDSLRLGGATAEGLVACTMDLSALGEAVGGAQGLLGLNFWKSFRVTIDFEREVLTLERP